MKAWSEQQLPLAYPQRHACGGLHPPCLYEPTSHPRMTCGSRILYLETTPKYQQSSVHRSPPKPGRTWLLR